MRTPFGAPGDFAQACVIAHEVGHQVQKLLGVTAKVDAQRGRLSEARMNALSVRVEWQADGLSGVWAHDARRQRQNLAPGDLEEALNAASKIGEHALQQPSRGTVRPETFSHRTSAQRVGWFKRGMASGRRADCNTFEARPL